jgi:hypothetical protein
MKERQNQLSVSTDLDIQSWLIYLRITCSAEHKEKTNEIMKSMTASGLKFRKYRQHIVGLKNKSPEIIICGNERNYN